MHTRALRARAALHECGDGLRWPENSRQGWRQKTMRWFLVMLALLFGAGPALAQSSGNPGPVTPASKVVKRHHHHIPRKRAAAKPQHDAQKAAAAIPAKPVPLPSPAPKKAVAKAAPAKTEPAKQTAKAEPPKPEPTKAEAAAAAPTSDAFAGIPAGERLKIQSALVWAGDYSSAEKGDDPTEAAIRNFQKRHKAKITGVLTSDQREELIAADAHHVDEFGWRVVVDPATGIRIGLPTKLVPDAHDAARGTRWSSPHGEVQVETFRVKSANLDLAKLFENEKKAADRKIESSVLHDDSFFISGMQGLKEFSVRARMRDGEVRGFTILYDQMMETIVEPVMVAMASAFSPFPEQPAPFAALAERVEYGTGQIVSAKGDIVAARNVTQGCEVIVADGLGNAERIAEDETSGLALLRVYGTAKLSALALARDVPTSGDITLVGIPAPREQDGARKLTEVKARLTDGHAIALRQPVPMAGFSGAAALDARGRFLGIMETRNFVLASAQPTVPPVRLIGAATIRDFLAKHHVETAQAASGDARASAVRIICVRK